MIEIRAGETDLAIAIMREVAQWCIEIGRPMWRLDELTREALLRNPPAGEDFRVAWVDDTPAASMILQWYDPLFWPDIPADGSGFIHKLCIRRDFAGRNLSTKIVEHAVSECKKKTIDLVRLDTDFANPRLCALYEGMGFVSGGRKRINGRDYALYELRVSNFRPSWPHMKVR